MDPSTVSSGVSSWTPLSLPRLSARPRTYFSVSPVASLTLYPPNGYLSVLTSSGRSPGLVGRTVRGSKPPWDLPIWSFLFVSLGATFDGTWGNPPGSGLEIPPARLWEPYRMPGQSRARQTFFLLCYRSSPLAVCFSATVLLITPSPTLQEGSTANLTCVVSRDTASESPANFSWFRNGQLWTQSLLPTVTLQPVGRRDAALYACRIWAEAIGQLSAPVILSVLCE